MKRLLYASTIITALMAAACASLNAPNHPSALRLRYNNTHYGLSFFLPVSWQGYSVLIQQWDDATYSPAADKIVVTDHGPMIVLRHPQWKASVPYQDIPILVFTRTQWVALHQGELWLFQFTPPWPARPAFNLFQRKSFQCFAFAH